MKILLLVVGCFLCLTLSAQKNLDQEKLIELPFEELDTLYKYAIEDFYAALSYAQALAEKTKRIHGDQDTSYGLRLISLGMQYYYLGNYQNTLKEWVTAKDIFKAEWGTKHPEYISILGNVALLHYYLGNYETSKKLTLEVKEIRAKTVGVEHEEYAFILNNLGLIYWMTEHYEAAEGAYLECKRILEQTVSDDHPKYANVLSNLASLYHQIGRYDEIEPLYLQSKDIMARAYGKEHPYYTASLANLATLYVSTNQPEKAEALHLEAKAIRARTIGTSHPEYSTGINDLGRLYLKTNQLEKAREELLEAKGLLETSLGQKHPDYLSTMNTLGQLYLKLGELDKAHGSSLKVKEISAEALGKQHTVYVSSLDNLVNVLIAKKEYQKAWNYVFESIRINTNQKVLSKKMDQKWADELATYDYLSNAKMDDMLEMMYELLAVNQSVENLEKQLVVADLATQLLGKNRQEYIGEADQLRLLSQSASWTHRAIWVLTKLNERTKDTQYQRRAFQFAELNKSVLLYNAVQTERAYVFGGLPDSLVLKEKRLQEKKANLKASLLEQLPADEYQELQRDLSGVNLDLNAFKKHIQQEYPRYSQLKYQQSAVSLETIKQYLDKETALLEYVVSDSFVHVFYVNAESIDMHTFPISKKVLTAAIDQLHKVLSSYSFLIKEPQLTQQVYTKEAYWLYQHLLEPILKNKKGIKNLVIVTDGELGHLPFETFLVENEAQNNDYKTMHYLIQDYTISYAYSASLFIDAQNTTLKDKSDRIFSGKQQMLALAGDYKTKEATELKHLLPTYQLLRQDLQPIKGAQKEVEILQNIFEGEFLWGTAANERFFKQEAKNYGIIHLAMHGVLNKKSPALSSLAFTENGDSLENNFLQAYEISQMELNANLVVLSACETGYGEFEEGNGIASLARSFVYAGVPSLVVSLWQVNDQSTTTIMRSFYNNLKNGLDKAEALRLAKLDYLQGATGISVHPAFWSPFIQLGATEPLELREKSNGWGFYLLLIGVLLFMGGFFYWNRKKG